MILREAGMTFVHGGDLSKTSRLELRRHSDLQDNYDWQFRDVRIKVTSMFY